jgi:Domain of unknown function
MKSKIKSYSHGPDPDFSPEWFDDIMQPPQNKWERAQLIGLGSVLITTVSFAAAFTVPGGYNQETGTPILGKRYVFKAFTLANSFSFAQAFISLYKIVSSALQDPDAVDLYYATYTFISAAAAMVLAFALGLYLVLSPIIKGIAVLVLINILPLGLPLLPFWVGFWEFLFRISINGFGLSRLTGTQSMNMVAQIIMWSLPTIFLFALLP